jgi:hypothetical protein
MLPFLKLNKEASVSMPADKVERKSDHPDEEDMDYLEGCIEELIAAIHGKDARAAARAFRDAFEVCESEPHEEYNEP